MHDLGLDSEVNVGPFLRDSNFLAENSRGPAVVYQYDARMTIPFHAPPQSTNAPPSAGHTAGFNVQGAVQIASTNPQQWQFADTTAAAPLGTPTHQWIPNVVHHPTYVLPQGAGEAINLPPLPFPTSHPAGYQVDMGHPLRFDGVNAGHSSYVYGHPLFSNSGSVPVNQLPHMALRQPPSHRARYMPYIPQRHENPAPAGNVGYPPPPAVQFPVAVTGPDAAGRTIVDGVVSMTQQPALPQALPDPPQIAKIPAIVEAPNDTVPTDDETALVSKARAPLDCVDKYLIYSGFNPLQLSKRGEHHQRIGQGCRPPQ